MSAFLSARGELQLAPPPAGRRRLARCRGGAHDGPYRSQWRGQIDAHPADERRAASDLRRNSLRGRKLGALLAAASRAEARSDDASHPGLLTLSDPRDRAPWGRRYRPRLRARARPDRRAVSRGCRCASPRVAVLRNPIWRRAAAGPIRAGPGADRGRPDRP